MKPAEPYQYYSSSSLHSLDLIELDDTISIAETKRQEAFDASAKIKVLIIKMRRTLEQQQEDTTTNNNNDLSQELETLIHNTLPSQQQDVRLANLSFQLIDYARLKSYQHFLSNGTLIPPSSLPSTLSDEEYLAGAVIGLTRDLARYSVGRATVRDADSVIIARNLVQSCLDYLMKFDFRNGMLRRRYDGVKYALKTCETVLYELSVTGVDISDGSGEGGGDDDDDDDDDAIAESDSKRIKVDDDNDKSNTNNDNSNNNDGVDQSDMPVEELEKLRLRITHRDELREKLIKRCRDAQKGAKQAIFALHRNDVKRATKLINECEQIVNEDLDPIVKEDPTLRYGSYTNVLEEYAEAKLYHNWLMGETKGQLLHPNDFKTVSLEPGDYLGGLCDLTGEVGRYAVQRGTKRDSEGVQFCLETNLSILFAIETLQRFPSGSQIHKKMDQLRNSVEKLERMLYELSLVKATGRQIVADSVNENNEEKRGSNKKNDDNDDN